MVIRKDKKVTKYRGTKTHGGGSMKKRRGAGHRGGRGRAGSGKRGDAKKPRYWKDKTDRGFTGRTIAGKTVNVGHLDSMIERLAREGRVEEKSGVFTVDSKKLGFARLLGTGFVHHKINITVDSATAKAKEKIEAVGGSVTTLVVDEAADDNQ